MQEPKPAAIIYVAVNADGLPVYASADLEATKRRVEALKQYSIRVFRYAPDPRVEPLEVS